MQADLSFMYILLKVQVLIYTHNFYLAGGLGEFC